MGRLSTTESTYLPTLEIANRFVAIVYVSLLWSSKEMKPLLQGQHNGQQLLFSDRVSSFSRLHFP